MAKKKFELSRDLVVSNKEVDDNNQPVVSMTIRVPLSFRSEAKAWCAKNNITISKALKIGFEYYKKSKFNP